MSAEAVPTVNESLSEEQLALINAHLNPLTPQEILKWGVENLPSLYQTTAFGLTGLVGIDMLSKITDSPPPLIFIDTLYHFQETLELVERVKKRYGIDVTIYKPNGCQTTQEFEKLYGERVWELNEELYDWVVKVRVRFGHHDYHRLLWIGRACPKGVQRTWSQVRYHGPKSVPRSRESLSSAFRNRCYRLI